MTEPILYWRQDGLELIAEHPNLTDDGSPLPYRVLFSDDTWFAVFETCDIACSTYLGAVLDECEAHAQESTPDREPRTGFQGEPVTIADTVSHQGPPPEANDGPELPLTPDEHRRGVISQETAMELLEWVKRLWGGDTDIFVYGLSSTVDGLIAQAEKELRGEQ